FCLRFEELLRAGDKPGAGAVREQLRQLEDDFAKARRLDAVASAQNALPMPAALGLAAALDENAVRERFSGLWNTADPGEREALWKKARETLAAKKDLGEEQLRLRFCALALDRVRQEPKAEALQRACDLVGLLTADGPRPAEAHYLCM